MVNLISVERHQNETDNGQLKTGIVSNNQGRFCKIEKKSTENKKKSSVGPNWLLLSEFQAETIALDKVSRVINNLVFGASLYGFYALATGGTGIAAYAS